MFIAEIMWSTVQDVMWESGRRVNAGEIRATVHQIIECGGNMSQTTYLVICAETQLRSSSSDELTVRPPTALLACNTTFARAVRSFRIDVDGIYARPPSNPWIGFVIEQEEQSVIVARNE